jgi:hypothetical protein
MSLTVQRSQDVVQSHATPDPLGQTVDGVGPLLDPEEMHRVRTLGVRATAIHEENL